MSVLTCIYLPAVVFCAGSRATLGIVLLLLASVSRGAVVTSIRPLGFIAAAIADSVMPVEVLLPNGYSPHNYSLRPSDIIRIKQADLLVWVGPELESFLNGPVASLADNRHIALANWPTIVPLLIKSSNKEGVVNTCFSHSDNNCLSEGYESTTISKKMEMVAFRRSEYNMHFWLSPKIARLIAEAIHELLMNLVPERKQKLDDNFRTFKSLLTKNDKNITKMLAPINGKGYYVFHDAYGYFEKHYGLNPLGYFTINPEIQPGAHALYKIRKELLQKKVTCIFAEPQFRPAVIDTVVRGTTVHIGTLDPLGSGIELDKDSYPRFLSQLSNQYLSCLRG